MKGAYKSIILLTVLAWGAGYLFLNNLTLAGLMDTVTILPLIVVTLVTVYTGYVHIFLHEFGHYFFGRLTGYELAYFQLLQLRYDVQTKQVKKVASRTSGMVGQCLMKPPAKGQYAEKPYELYLSGGLIFNLLTAVILFVLSYFTTDLTSFVLFCLSLPPLYMFLTNAIPVGLTDGGIIREISRSETAKKLYFKQLELAALFEEGETFVEIPDVYFAEVEDGSYAESRLGEYIVLIAYQRALAVLDFEKADHLLQDYQKHWHYLSSPYAPLIASELLFCDAIFGRKEAAEKIMALIEKYPVLKGYYQRSTRTQAAYSFFVKTDIKETKNILQQSAGSVDSGLNEAELALQETLTKWLKSFLGLEAV